MPLVDTILGYLMQREQNKMKSEMFEQQKEEWKIKKQQLDMAVEERDKRAQLINSLPDDIKKIAMLHPQGGADILKINALINQLSGVDKQQGQQFIPESTPEPYETPTGKFLPAAQNPQSQQPNLLNQLTQGQLGIGPNQLLQGLMKKEFGVEDPNEPVGRPQPMPNPAFGNKMQMGISLRNNKVVFLNDNQGNPLLIPPDITYEAAMRNGITIKEARDKKGNRMPQFDIENIPQEMTSVSGAMTPQGGPGTAFFQRNLPPGTKPFVVPHYVPPIREQQEKPGGGTKGVWVDAPFGGRGALDVSISPRGTTQIPSVEGGYTKLPPGDRPIDEKEVINYIDPKTYQPIPFGATPNQAKTMGAKKLNDVQIKQLESFNTSLFQLQTMKSMMEKVIPYPNTKEASYWDATIEKYLEGGAKKMSAFFETNPDATNLERYIKGTIFPMIKGMGAGGVGAISDKEGERAEGLAPKLISRSATAWQSFDNMVDIFAGGRDRLFGQNLPDVNQLRSKSKGGVNLQPGGKPKGKYEKMTDKELMKQLEGK